MSEPSVAFFVPDEPELDRIVSLDCDEQWREFVMGERCWILQTYLRLKSAGCNVTISNQCVDCDVAIVHPFFLKDLLSAYSVAKMPIVVITADDKGYCPQIDFQLVQNRQASGDRSIHVPLWPQPGLKPRDSERGTTIERVAYKGFDACLHPDFRSQEWFSGLESLGVEWEEDSFLSQVYGFSVEDLHWDDFRQTDIVIGVRPNLDDLYIKKPATKLINAWLAGVPALLGPEFAFREMRQSDLDYIEIRTPADSLAAVKRLQENPSQYQDMVDNGRERVKGLGREFVLECWRKALFETIPGMAASGDVPLLRDSLKRRLTSRLWSWRICALRDLGHFLRRVKGGKNRSK